MPKIVRAGAFTGVGPAPDALAFSPDGSFNFRLRGSFVATVRLARSFDGGQTWDALTYVDGTPMEWSGPVNTTLDEPEDGALYRPECVTFTSGPAEWRLGQ